MEKAYIACYNNGLRYENFEEYGNKVYLNEDDCIKEILDEGYAYDEELEIFISCNPKDIEDGIYPTAEIIEVELIR